MRERQGTYDLPRRVEKVVEFEKPKVCMTVKLPYCSEFTFDQKRYFRVSVHTDMLLVFKSTLRELKPQIRGKLFIEGRVINETAWERLREHPAYDFFLNSRFYRRWSSHRKETIRLLMPKTSKVTETQARHYVGLDFKPGSLSKRLGFGVGWYPANFLLNEDVNSCYYQHSLAPFLSGVNQFRIGSNRLESGIVRMVGIRMMMDFENETHRVVDSITGHISEKALEASAKIFKFER